MALAQKVTFLVHGLRKKEKVRVRQPLKKLMVPVLDSTMEQRLKAVENLILSEVNVKELAILTDSSDVLVKQVKPNFKTLGKKVGKLMKQVAAQIGNFTQEDITQIEKNGGYSLEVDGAVVELDQEDFVISTQDIPGWLVASEGEITVALDIIISDELRQEGLAREMINRIQNLRKDKGFEVTDKIELKIKEHQGILEAVNNNFNYICSETLAASLEVVQDLKEEEGQLIDVDDEIQTVIAIEKKSD